MKLYDSARAPNPRRVRWFLAEKGVDDIELVNVDLMKGEQKTEAYLSRIGVPFAPALELDDGTVITESIAICRYLESLHPEPNMFGRDAREVALIEMWTRRAEFMLATPLMLAVRHTHPALAVLESPQVREVGAVNLSAASAALATFDKQLADHPFIAGERITIADIVAVIGLDFGRMARFAVPDSLTDLTRWRGEMLARPAAKAGF